MENKVIKMFIMFIIWNKQGYQDVHNVYNMENKVIKMFIMFIIRKTKLSRCS